MQNIKISSCTKVGSHTFTNYTPSLTTHYFHRTDPKKTGHMRPVTTSSPYAVSHTHTLHTLTHLPTPHLQARPLVKKKVSSNKPVSPVAKRPPEPLPQEVEAAKKEEKSSEEDDGPRKDKIEKLQNQLEMVRVRETCLVIIICY